jgi:hypothetical protein
MAFRLKTVAALLYIDVLDDMMPDLFGSAEMGESSQCSHRSLSRTEAGHLLCAQGKKCRIAVLKSWVYAFLMCLKIRSYA